MTFQQMALRMYPYWLMGIFMFIAVYNSKHKNLLRVEPKQVLKWIGCLALLTVYRIVLFKIFEGNDKLHNMTQGAMMIPWQATLTVAWEDMCHSVPLVLLSLRLGNDKLWKRMITYAAILLVMTSFGLGHVYQGWIAAALLSLYIPFTFKKGQEVGFGTVMICHTLYDLVTILTIKSFLG